MGKGYNCGAWRRPSDEAHRGEAWLVLDTLRFSVVCMSANMNPEELSAIAKLVWCENEATASELDHFLELTAWQADLHACAKDRDEAASKRNRGAGICSE